MWHLRREDGESVYSVPHFADGDSPPAVPILKWFAGLRIGEGKERDLAAARDCAVWPEATDAELMAEPDVLRAALAARLPGLLAEFKAAMTETCGFLWEPATA